MYHTKIRLFYSPGTTKAKVTYGFSKFRKSRYIYIAAAMLIGKRMSTSPFSPYNLIETSPTSSVHKSVFIGPNDRDRLCGLDSHIEIWANLHSECIKKYQIKKCSK